MLIEIAVYNSFQLFSKGFLLFYFVIQNWFELNIVIKYKKLNLILDNLDFKRIKKSENVHN
jgi:hypothetical protein